ncbi:MAG: nucleotidyltransferase domain-containing protein [Ignavibacterium sp.]|uniref:nucleotidyltransferase domain-containing protein n=1 Tax=Ignavibacterium sp. TaxID=2651167 RepID=UPI004049A267
MRISKEEIELLRKVLSELDSEARIYLFGSRVYDEKKGGDIDLLVVSKILARKDLRKIKREFFNKFGEQKIDIVLDDGEFKNPFTEKIIKEAVEL